MEDRNKVTIRISPPTEAEHVCGYLVKRTLNQETRRVYGHAKPRREVGFTWTDLPKFATWYDTRKDAEDAIILAQQILHLKERMTVIKVVLREDA